ncbi:hypothetical protein B0H14DRAFT_2339234 [Mycena olivaceomarginata]|nr:hypothetical protein B0H14DRAFT_2339234 [Mycena olivaceomarginata]
MHFFNLVLAFGLGSLVHVAPTEDDLFILRIEKVGEYDLTYYSSSTTPVAAPAAVPRACGTNNVLCAADNGATPAVCKDLITILSTNPTLVLNLTPAAICLSQTNGQTNNYWNANVGAMQQGTLFATANKVYNICLAPSALRQSGVALNAILNGVCVTHCLSNRPTGCL